MDERFWGTYQSIVFKKCYYEEHQRRAECLLFWAKAICAAVSILSVLVWSVSRSVPILWACLIALAQIAQTMLGFVPWSQQLSALRYLIPELDGLIVDIDTDWMRLHYTDNANNDEFIEKAANHERRFFDAENRFAEGIWFPVVGSVVKKAEKAADSYFLLRYFPVKGSEEIDSKAPANADTRQCRANSA